jgi:FKBP-type peptidyl-prolyl cis-trans isomerase
MRSFHVIMALVLTVPAIAQSKKELQAEVNRLKTESQNLKTEIENLKKPKEVVLTDTADRASYGIGVMIASNIKMQGFDSLNIEALQAGINDILFDKQPKLDQNEAQMVVQQFMMNAMEKKARKAKEEGQSFLNTNKTKEGVKTTASGLQYKVLKSGNGKMPKATDNVTVHYTGKLLDGTVFDSSVERGSPATFEVTGVIAGWTEVLQLMKEGDKWEVYIPSDLAYGDRGAGGQIPPHATLIFEVELLKVN